MSVSQSLSPSFLDSARFCVSVAPGASSPLKYFDQTLTSGTNALSDDSQSSGTEKKFLCFGQDLHREKLNLSKKDVLLLSAVARDARREHVDINWANFLPLLLHIDNLSNMVPIFMTHNDPGLHRHDMESSVLRKSSPSTPKDLSSHVESVIGELKHEKLSCSKKSLVFIKTARKCDTYPDDMIACFNATLRPYQETHKPNDFLSPMSSSQFYSPPPSPKSRMSPDPQGEKKKESNSRKHLRKPKTVPQKNEDGLISSSPFTALGSLTSFMETRSKVCGRQVNAKSPYFPNKGQPAPNSRAILTPDS